MNLKSKNFNHIYLFSILPLQISFIRVDQSKKNLNRELALDIDSHIPFMLKSYYDKVCQKELQS